MGRTATSSRKRSSDSTADKKNSSKRSRKSPNNSPNLELLGDIDSLKSIKGRKSLKDIDNKIKNLKSELLSLEEKSPEAASCESENNTRNSDSPTFEICKKNPKNSSLDDYDSPASINCHKIKKAKNTEDNNSPEVLSSPGPSSFLNCLNSGSNDTEVGQKGSKLLNPLFCKNDTDCDTLCKHSTSYKDAKKLLYKSFRLQNLQKYSSSSDECEPELVKLSKNKTKKSKSRKTPKRTNKRNLKQNNVSKKFSRRKGRKGARVVYDIDSDVEVIDLESNPLRRSARNKNVEIDLDIENLDWDEPFDLKSNTDTNSSDLEIIETGDEETYTPPKRKKLPSALSKQTNLDLGISRESENENGKRREWECPICFEQSVGQEIVTTLCGHVFCKKCIEKCDSSKRRICPSCRTDITNKQLITLFNF